MNTFRMSGKQVGWWGGAQVNGRKSQVIIYVHRKGEEEDGGGNLERKEETTTAGKVFLWNDVNQRVQQSHSLFFFLLFFFFFKKEKKKRTRNCVREGTGFIFSSKLIFKHPVDDCVTPFWFKFCVAGRRRSGVGWRRLISITSFLFAGVETFFFAVAIYGLANDLSILMLPILFRFRFEWIALCPNASRRVRVILFFLYREWVVGWSGWC